MPIIVVEGDTDETFFEKLNELSPLSLEPEASGGNRQKLQDHVKALLRAGTTDVIIAEDIDKRDPEQVVQSHRDSISTFLGCPAESLNLSGSIFNLGAVKLAIIPMGLDQDSDLASLGVTSHALEDYLLRLPCQDPSLRSGLPLLLELSKQLTDTIRGEPYYTAFDSSKELFQLIKPLVKHGFSDTRIVQRIFDQANPEILLQVMTPLITQLEEAVAA